MSFRNILAMGLLNALLCTGFSGNALAGSFTNGDLTTFGQSDWGDTAGGTDGQALLLANYDSVYASSSGGFEVGIPGPIGFSMVFTDASDIDTYLPDGGVTGQLDSDLLNPTSTSSGAFGGDVVALKLNIDFSDAGLLPGNLSVHFGDLVLQNFTKIKPDRKSLSALNGLTVRQFAADVNTLLGGGSFGIFTTADIPVFDSIVANLNTSFGGGGLGQFATNNLAVAQVPLVMQTASHSGNSITLTWSTTPTEMYQVEFITDLTQTNWTNLGSPIRATNFTWTASETMTNSRVFYRIDQLP
jgi:hypothetical protein